MAGKADKRRPCHVPYDKYANNFDNIFRKKQTEVTINGNKFTQYWKDSDNNSPSLPPNTRVIYGSKEGTVLYQQLHHDGSETFFGDVFVHMDDERLIHNHCWMFKIVPESPEEVQNQ